MRGTIKLGDIRKETFQIEDKKFRDIRKETFLYQTPNGASNEIDWVSKFYNSFSFRAKQNALRHIYYALWFLKDLFMKIANWIFFRFFMILSKIKKRVYLCLFEHANTRKHAYEHSCSSVRVILSISAHSAHLAQFFFLVSKAISEQMYW